MLDQLFFASSRIYQPCDIIRLVPGTHAPHLNGAVAPWLLMEAAFEAAKPAGHPSRISSRFACKTMEDCLAYYHPQPGGTAGKHVYRVFMTDPVAVPMALTGWGLQHYAAPAALAAIAQEYWAQNLHEWEFLEYLAPELGVIDEVLTPPDAMLLAASTVSYQNDRDRARVLWP